MIPGLEEEQQQKGGAELTENIKGFYLIFIYYLKLIKHTKTQLPIWKT